MNPSAFLAEFSHIAQAPGGVQRLREMILQLAVQGKLVEQDPGDEPASELLKRIEAEKNHLVKDGINKKKNVLPPILEKELPFILPTGWEWIRLGEMGFWKAGSTPNRSNSAYYGGDIPWVKSGEVKQGSIFNTEEKITDLAIKECTLPMNPVGAILIAMYGANIGEIGILEIEATTNQAVCACTTYTGINKYFLLNVLSSMKDYFCKVGAGAAQPNISREKIIISVAPLPPLAEQQRIVVKVEQLMSLCDRLETQQNQRRQVLIQTRQTALESLASAPAGPELRTAWNRVEANLGLLFETPEDVDDLKKCLLQNAVMGKLVPQNPADEPAAVLLEKIQAEKAEMIVRGEIKKDKALPAIRDDEKPFAIPLGWEWCRIEKIVSILGDGIHGTPNYTINGGYFFINGNNLNDGKIDLKLNTKQVDRSEYLKHKKKLNMNSVLVSINGTLGNIAFFNNEPVILGKSACYFNLLYGIEKEYIKLIICGNYFIEYALKTATGTTIKNVSLFSMRNLGIPLPPLAEQQRIVAKVQSLLALCDTLQSQITAVRKVASLLAQAALETLTGISMEKPATMKIPKTELVSKLILAKHPAATAQAPLSALLSRHNDELSAKALWNHSGLTIDEFYRQLKTEMVAGWIVEPHKAEVRTIQD